jgi:hypothetical protein
VLEDARVPFDFHAVVRITKELGLLIDAVSADITSIQKRLDDLLGAAIPSDNGNPLFRIYDKRLAKTGFDSHANLSVAVLDQRRVLVLKPFEKGVHFRFGETPNRFGKSLLGNGI